MRDGSGWVRLGRSGCVKGGFAAGLCDKCMRNVRILYTSLLVL